WQGASGGCALHGFAGHQCRHVVGAALGHQARAFLVEERAVLDARHARADRALDALGAVCVRRDAAVQRARLGDHRDEFFLAVLRRADALRTSREHTGGRAGLDHVSAALHLVAYGTTHFIDAIGDAGLRRAVEEAGAIVVLVAVTA